MPFTRPEARACFQRVQSRLEARGEWRPEYAFGLWPLAEGCADYITLAREVRALKDLNPRDLEKLEASVERERLSVREWMAEFLVISFARVPLAPVNSEGLDKEIADLCAPLPQLAATSAAAEKDR